MDTPRVLELKSALAKVSAEADRIISTITDETGDGRYVLSTEKKDAIQSNMDRADEIKFLIEAESRNAGYGDAARVTELAPESKSLEIDANAVDAHKSRGGYDEAKSLGDAFLESAEFKSFIESGARGDMTPFVMERKDIHTGSLTGNIHPLGFGSIQRDPWVQYPHRTRRVRELFPAMGTSANLVEFYKVTGLVNNAAMVPERDTTTNPDTFGAKPQSTVTFSSDSAPVRTIAHWEAAHRTALADEPQLRGIIDNELLYGLRLAEDAQLLQGSGSGENIRGILNTPDIQTYAWSDGPTGQHENRADAVRRSITKAILANYEATGVVVNPLDWEDIELTKDNEGRYLATIGIAIGAEQRLWRLPVVDTPAMPEGTWLTGAFGIAAQIYDREAASIRMAEQHADFFTRNAVVILAEQRLAMAVKRPEAFVKGTFDNAPV